ncbi:MAG: Coenzyme F420 hydrogenase/dehydrogenase, beta subunit C-terminal domain [Spirochaetes bacterium]|nr:Coenzyme F420 hydrogenase/dehydrogenase, beta subunit C-terminal domain [Spirochaetota bacterium]
MNPRGPVELKAEVMDRGLCIGCGACVSLCPYFHSYRGKTSMLFPCVLPAGRCHAYCPKTSVDLDLLSDRIFGAPFSLEPMGRHLSVRASRAAGKDRPGNVQSGGTVTALMTHALESGVIDAAVLTGREGIHAIPGVVTDPADVARYATSKFGAAPTVAAYHHAVADGYSSIGVVATPCQALALAQISVNPMDEPGFVNRNALVVGIFCTWALDERGLASLVADRVKDATITKFDIPPPPAEVMEIHTDQGTIEIPLSDVRALVPDTCGYCFDMTAEFADISVGQLEGSPGMNTIIIRTERGRRLVENAADAGCIELLEMPESNLSRLADAAMEKKERALAGARNMGIIAYAVSC